jgi:hypothetical protein
LTEKSKCESGKLIVQERGSHAKVILGSHDEKITWRPCALDTEKLTPGEPARRKWKWLGAGENVLNEN